MKILTKMTKIERETRAAASHWFHVDGAAGSYAEAVRMREDMGQLGTDTSTSTFNIFCDPWAIFAWFKGCRVFSGKTGRELTLDEGSIQAGSPSAMESPRVEALFITSVHDIKRNAELLNPIQLPFDQLINIFYFN
jgi:hypothetical protein